MIKIQNNKVKQTYLTKSKLILKKMKMKMMKINKKFKIIKIMIYKTKI